MSRTVHIQSADVGRREGPITVAVLARLAGSTPDTVRYYEKVGLLPAPERSPAGYRHYRSEAVDRLRFIQGAQRLGLHLREIAELLGVRDSGVCPCGEASVLLRQRMQEIDEQIADLSRLRATLARMVDQIPSDDCPDPVPGVWKPPAVTTAEFPSGAAPVAPS
jgi:DNA-binding transcriptional MerR regulator